MELTTKERLKLQSDMIVLINKSRSKLGSRIFANKIIKTFDKFLNKNDLVLFECDKKIQEKLNLK